MSRYVLDKSSSTFTVRAFAAGMLSSFGHDPTLMFRDFSGEVNLSPDRPADSSLALKVRADSLEVTNDISGSDRREIEGTARGDVLETAKYPEISFQSTRAALNSVGEGRYQVNINGNLSLHGVTVAVPIPAQVTVMGDLLRASGEFSISQKQFGIKPVSAAGGALKLKDELKLRFDIVGHAENGAQD